MLAKIKGSTIPASLNQGVYHGVKSTYVWEVPKDTCLLALSWEVSGTVVRTSANEEVFVSTDGSLIRLILKGQVGECGRAI
jgi:hypothetical protein